MFFFIEKHEKIIPILSLSPSYPYIIPAPFLFGATIKSPYWVDDRDKFQTLQR